MFCILFGIILIFTRKNQNRELNVIIIFLFKIVQHYFISISFLMNV